MPTYLLAWVIGEFDYIEAFAKSGTPIRVYTPVGEKASGEFALDVAVKSIDYFAEYFDIPFMLPKLDLIGIANYPIGAMENWGLMTFRATAILCDSKTSAAGKQRVAYVVSHECSHNWFGDYVTPVTWNQLWLKEGFATYLEYMACNEFFPDWGVWSQVIQTVQFPALRLDSMESSHAVEVEAITSPAGLSEIFDVISYLKGCSLIRFIVAWCGESAVQQGLRTFLTEHAYSNAVN
eukprot:TRINITY_DN4002_c0_g1_i2.p1 TRINITY_DN4002_c0_g1~~TRINITY_DN4002_c0_g1_i2.p1  ORF type:complete len:246 (-),score=57.25 TRINITY_DN4002_c0_g1_i2:200-907(-)